MMMIHWLLMIMDSGIMALMICIHPMSMFMPMIVPMVKMMIMASQETARDH
jgi:hypothetical protein